jgi:hypothetical protein
MPCSVLAFYGRFLFLVCLAGVLLLAPAQVQAAGGEPVVISELMFRPPGDQRQAQFIELFNAGSSPVSLAGW